MRAVTVKPLDNTRNCLAMKTDLSSLAHRHKTQHIQHSSYTLMPAARTAKCSESFIFPLTALKNLLPTINVYANIFHSTIICNHSANR